MQTKGVYSYVKTGCMVFGDNTLYCVCSYDGTANLLSSHQLMLQSYDKLMLLFLIAERLSCIPPHLQDG